VASIFLGTPAAAVPSLSALADVADIDLVITQPDRPAGRGRQFRSSPVAVAAHQFGFPVEKPQTKEELLDVVRSGSHSFGLIVAYGRILSPEMISSTDLGFLNVHFSLLPRWRGPAPVERALAAGDERTGITLMKIDEGLDTGPILGEIATPIGPNETGGSLTARLAFLGASLVDATVPDFLNGRRSPVPQIDAHTTHASVLTKQEAQLDPQWPAARAERTIRAFTPRPGAWLSTPDGIIRVHEARTTAEPCAQGEIVSVGSHVLAGFADGAVELLAVQPAGRQRLGSDAWMNGRRGEATAFAAPAP
jgi:methionyl-tRNA formyltransferase